MTVSPPATVATRIVPGSVHTRAEVPYPPVNSNNESAQQRCMEPAAATGEIRRLQRRKASNKTRQISEPARVRAVQPEHKRVSHAQPASMPTRSKPRSSRLVGLPLTERRREAMALTWRVMKAWVTSSRTACGRECHAADSAETVMCVRSSSRPRQGLARPRCWRTPARHEIDGRPANINLATPGPPVRAPRQRLSEHAHARCSR